MNIKWLGKVMLSNTISVRITMSYLVDLRIKESIFMNLIISVFLRVLYVKGQDQV